MRKGLSGWLLYKWLLVFILSVLVVPGLLDDVPGPSNEDSCNVRKRRVVAYCRKCGFRAETEKRIEDHECEAEDSEKATCTHSTDKTSAPEIYEPPEKAAKSDKESTPFDRRKSVECDLCGAIQRSDNLKRHRGSRFCRIRCNECGDSVKATEYETHKKTHTMNLNFDITTSSSSAPPTPVDDTTEIDNDLVDIYNDYRKQIDDYTCLGRILSTFNFKLERFSVSELCYLFKQVFRKQKNAFKINVSIGVILRNRVTGELAYYRSSQNNQLLFDTAQVIRNSCDKSLFLEKLENLGLLEKVNRPNSQWTLAMVTNATFHVYKLTGVPIGAHIDLPKHLLNNNGLFSLIKNKRGKPYEDSKCLFRCIAMHQGAIPNNLERRTNKLVKFFCEKTCIHDFVGVTVDQLEEVSRLFQIPIKVYEQDEARNTDLVFRSTLEGDKPLNLNIYGNHFSFIKDIDLYSRSYRCPKCDKIWSHHGNFMKHVKVCDIGVKRRYVNGTFQLKTTMIEELEDKEGILVPPELRVFPYRATLDIECMLKESTQSDTAKMQFSSEHDLVSISVCSNVPGYKSPKCFTLSGMNKQRELVKQAINYLLEISDKSSEILKEKYADVIERISSEQLKDKFVDTFLQQLPVITFNGAKYDLNVLKNHLIPVLVEMDCVRSVIKKGTSYMTIILDELKFLDIVFFLAPGFNYSSFLKAYGATESKSYFPYGYLDSYEKLDSNKFPEYADFFSTLKGRNTLEPENIQDLEPSDLDKIHRNPSENEKVVLSEEERITVGHLRYDQLRILFESNKWTMRDYLKYYNNLDVVPFLTALQNLSIYYKDRGVDVFKDAISVPGIAERLAFKSLKSDEVFFLFNRQNKDVVSMLRENLVGGPAIIYDRYQEVGVTKIRHDLDGKDCTAILGYDANALYLGCMAENMPTGSYLRRKREDGYRKSYPHPCSAASIEWLAFVEREEEIAIQHARNASEYRVGDRKIAVDGFCKENHTVYQYHGCYFHGCLSCHITDRDVKIKYRKSFNEKYEKTVEISKYIRDCGYSLVEMWECSWTSKKQNLNVKQHKYLYPLEDKFRVTQKGILDSILNGELFGAILCDIEVPNELREQFSEMAPIFKNVNVTLDDIGPDMRDYLKSVGEKFKDTRYLIGSLFGERILLITPLIMWYLEHGLTVSKIYEVIQFKPMKCFKRFADSVSNDRRAGDMDPTKKIVAETSKLLGNSVYGHSILNKERHSKVKFCDLYKASKSINDPFFVDLEEFDNETFEVKTKIKTIRYDTPFQLGYFVYQFAKLKILEFYYDCIDRFVDRADFCLLEMDTDSLYLALSGKTLDDVIRPELRDEWEEAKEKWFPRTDTPENIAFDKRTPGLFKLEWSGEGFLGLNAKSYFCFKHGDGEEKYSSKGVSKRNRLTKEDYMAVLKMNAPYNTDHFVTSEIVSTQENRGFILKGSKMMTYAMTKEGLKNFYCKRIVQSNGLSTKPLDI